MAARKSLEQRVANVAKGVDRDALMDALAGAVGKVQERISRRDSMAARLAEEARDGVRKGATKRRRSTRVGHREYKPTPQAERLLRNVRLYTFRRYMIETILTHNNTTDAAVAHASSKRYEKEKLNFKWAADNGYIEFA